jgi:hypothetical protein
MQELFVKINEKRGAERPRLPVLDAYDFPSKEDAAKFWVELGTTNLSIFNRNVNGVIWCQYWEAWRFLQEHGWFHIGHKDQYLHWFKPDDEEADLLAILLQIHDWTYQYADDHRSWAAGEANWQRIKDTAARMSKEQVHEIWMKYAPQRKEDYYHLPGTGGKP